jgi:dihydroorotase
VDVTCEAAPHHLTLTDAAIESLDPNLKMNPPLREESDRQALVEGLKTGLVDCVATDHAPHASEEKDVPFEEAPFGTIGLETAFSVLYGGLVVPKAVDLATLVTRMSAAPARLAGIAVPSLAAGSRADLCLVDPKARWTVSRETLQSRSFNSAWLGKELGARVMLTVAAGHVAWDQLA